MKNSNPLSQNRITSIDGLRAIAVLGVLWVHNWSFWFGGPRTKILNVDFNRLFAAFGTGVNLFFVISGFCMYLVYGKIKEHNFSSFKEFIVKRYIRIAPACMASVIITGLWFSYKYGNIEWYKSLPYFATFTNPFFGYGGLLPHYWSLSTEFQFYLILPLFFYLSNKIGFWKTWLSFMAVSLLFVAILFALRLPNFVETYHHPVANIFRYTILYRFAEFGWGMAVCKIFIDHIAIPKWITSIYGFFIGFLIMYTGRLLDTQEIVHLFLNTGIDILIRTISFPMLTLGYALMLLNLLYSDTVFTRFLNTNIIQLIGKYSYSIYLWHWVIGEEIAYYIGNLLGKSSGIMWASFFLEIIILIPIGALSYKLFEQFYFKLNKPNHQNSKIAVKN